MRRVVPLLLIVIGAAALALWTKGYFGSPTPTPTIENRIPKLKQLIAEQEVESAKAISSYTPTSKAHLDDLNTSVVDILKSLPGVVQVEISVTAKKPTSRIIHLRDWHFVPKELYALDMRQVHGRELTDEEIDRLHGELLLQVELVQLEQMAALRCLIKHHGLKMVFSEGFSPHELQGYREKIAGLRTLEKEQIPQIRKQLEEVRKLLATATGERKEKAKAIEAELVGLLDEQKHRLLEVGAAGRLLIAGELEHVLPLEDADALEKAMPISPSGGMNLDPGKIEARHDAQVKSVMKQGPVAVIVLGGSHDLTGSIDRIGGGNCEYLRVTTKRFREISE